MESRQKAFRSKVKVAHPLPIFESRNLQALPVNVRSRAIDAIVPLIAPCGTLLVFTRYRDTDAEPDGPPWPLSETELDRFRELGLTEICRDSFPHSDTIQQLRLEYCRQDRSS